MLGRADCTRDPSWTRLDPNEAFSGRSAQKWSVFAQASGGRENMKKNRNVQNVGTTRMLKTAALEPVHRLFETLLGGLQSSRIISHSSC